MVRVEGARDRGAQALHGPRGEQPPVVLVSPPASEARVNRPRPTRNISLAPEQVARAPAEQHETGEGDRVGVHDPLQARGAEPEVGAREAARDVHDGDADANDEETSSGIVATATTSQVGGAGLGHVHIAASAAVGVWSMDVVVAGRARPRTSDFGAAVPGPPVYGPGT